MLIQNIGTKVQKSRSSNPKPNSVIKYGIIIQNMYKQFYYRSEQESRQSVFQRSQEKVHFLEEEMNRIKKQCYRLLEIQKLKNQKLQETIEEKDLMIAYLRAQLDVLNQHTFVQEQITQHNQFYPNSSSPKISHNFNVSTEISPDSKNMSVKFAIGPIQKRINEAINFGGIINDLPVSDSELNSEMNETTILQRKNSNNESNIVKQSSEAWQRIVQNQQDTTEKVEKIKEDIGKRKGGKGKIGNKGKAQNSTPIPNKRKSQSFQTKKSNSVPSNELKQKKIPQKFKKAIDLQSDPKIFLQKSTKNFITNPPSLHKK